MIIVRIAYVVLFFPQKVKTYGFLKTLTAGTRFILRGPPKAKWSGTK